MRARLVFEKTVVLLMPKPMTGPAVLFSTKAITVRESRSW